MKTIKCPFCGANEETQFTQIGCTDNPQAEPNYAYNIYLCECDAICKKNVWNNKCELWIDPLSNNIKFKR